MLGVNGMSTDAVVIAALAYRPLGNEFKPMLKIITIR